MRLKVNSQLCLVIPLRAKNNPKSPRSKTTLPPNMIGRNRLHTLLKCLLRTKRAVVQKRLMAESPSISVGPAVRVLLLLAMACPGDVLAHL